MFFDSRAKGKNKTLRSVMSDLDKYIIASAFLIFALFLSGTFIIQNQSSRHIEETDSIEFESTLRIYTLNLVGQISLIASSTTFLEYLRSGAFTRKSLERDFYELMSRLPKKNYAGLTISNVDNEIIFSTGEVTENIVTLPLCYVGDNFNSKFGRCVGEMQIYIDGASLLNELIKLNQRIQYCDNCHPIESLPDIHSELFKYHSKLSLYINIRPPKDGKYFYAIGFTVLFTIILLISLFLRTMILKVLNHYIIEPITKITSSVHSADFNNATLVEVLKIQQRNEVLQAKAIAEDKQNKWLASELHDELGAQLVSLKWSLQAIEQNNSAANLTTAKENLNRLISLVKNFIAELRPEELETLGLSKSLDLMVVKRNNQAGLCRYKLTNQTKDEEISGAFSHAIYRVCQESLTNIAKHSSATSAEISMHIEWLSNNTRILELKVRDNGNGFSYNESFKPGGHGIDSMKERVISLGGVFQLLTEPGAGTEILVMLPLPLPFE